MKTKRTPQQKKEIDTKIDLCIHCIAAVSGFIGSIIVAYSGIKYLYIILKIPNDLFTVKLCFMFLILCAIFWYIFNFLLEIFTTQAEEFIKTLKKFKLKQGDDK